jgi:exodeoxyribonuclease VII small subunit
MHSLGLNFTDQIHGINMATKKKPELEQALEELESVVEQLERGDMSLDESLKAFEQGVRLTRQCQTILSAAEQKVQQLIELNGELHGEPFHDDTTDTPA